MDAEKPTIPQYPNLRPFSQLERERTIEIARKGGIASGIARKKRRTFAEEIKIALNSNIQPSHPKYAEIKRMLRSSGLLADGEEPTNQLLVVFGMIQAAQKKPEAATFLRDTAGEKPTEIIGNIDIPAAPVVIGVHDSDFIAAERRKQIAERDEIVSERVRNTQIEAAIAEAQSTPEADKSEERESENDTQHAEQANQDAKTAAESAQDAAVIAPETEKDANETVEADKKAETAPVDAPVETERTTMPPEEPKPTTAESARPVQIEQQVPQKVGKHRPGKYVCIPAAFPRR